jgi:hypothetical protein
MSEPWDLKISDERSADTLKTFIIFCEDEHHERLYFTSFENHRAGIKINAIGNQKQRKLNFNNTIVYCVNTGLIVFEDNGYKIADGITEYIWCVYDRDMENEDFSKIPKQNNIDFDTAIQTAINAGLNVAWSNDIFEMWLLLHFEEIPTGNILHRSYIYKRLTEIFKHHVPQTTTLAVLTANATFNYKDNIKKRDVFLTEVIPLLHSRTEIAIRNAEKLEKQFANNTPFHLRNPCTMVHYLVQKILN